MAMGSYRIATEAYRPTHISSGKATTPKAELPDIAGMFGKGFQTMIKAGMTYYKGVEDVGKTLQGVGHKVSGWQSDSAVTSMTSEWGC